MVTVDGPPPGCCHPTTSGPPEVVGGDAPSPFTTSGPSISTFTEATRSHAAQPMRELIKTGEIERHEAQDWVDSLVKTSGNRSAALISTVRAEVWRSPKGLGHRRGRRCPRGWPHPFESVHGSAPTQAGQEGPHEAASGEAHDKKLKKALGA
jgi:hypothetical protein